MNPFIMIMMLQANVRCDKVIDSLIEQGRRTMLPAVRAELMDMGNWIWGYTIQVKNMIGELESDIDADKIFDDMVMSTVVGEDMENAAHMAMRYLVARDQEERRLGFKTPCMEFLRGMDLSPLLN